MGQATRRLDATTKWRLDSAAGASKDFKRPALRQHRVTIRSAILTEQKSIEINRLGA